MQTGRDRYPGTPDGVVLINLAEERVEMLAHQDTGTLRNGIPLRNSIPLRPVAREGVVTSAEVAEVLDAD